VAYNKEEIIQKALQVIEQENCTNISEVLLFLPISTSTFYEWELEKSEVIRSKIDAQKVAIKAKMKKKWYNSDVPALAIAAFKLIAAEDEADALNTSKVNTTHQFKDKPTINLIMPDGYKVDNTGS
jgi:DNA helicase TIP49 (TBP-interacting protein)